MIAGYSPSSRRTGEGRDELPQASRSRTVGRPPRRGRRRRPQAESAVAGGADTASDAPLGVNGRLRRILLEARRAKSPGARLRALARIRPFHLVPGIPRNAEPRTGPSLGEHAAVTARAWGIAREAQDELAAASHQRLAAAYERGFFEDLAVPFRGLARDRNLRPGSAVEKLAAPKPFFGLEDPGPTMTAGNSTPLTDGAATVPPASEEWAAARGLEPLAYRTAYETAAVDFAGRGPAGQLPYTAPVSRCPRRVPESRHAVRAIGRAHGSRRRKGRAGPVGRVGPHDRRPLTARPSSAEHEKHSTLLFSRRGGARAAVDLARSRCRSTAERAQPPHNGAVRSGS